MTKYRAVKTTIDGIKFDSAKEAARYSELKMLERAGVVRDVRHQVRIELQPKFTAKDGTKIRAIVYVADFTYYRATRQQVGKMKLLTPSESVREVLVIEDSKGFRTKDYLLKKKLLLYKIANREIDGEFIES